MNISSIVVKTASENLDRVMASLKDSGLCEIHFHDESGKIIVTVEGENVSEEMKKMKAIQNLPEVLSADLSYSYSEQEMQEAMEMINRTGAVPEMLSDDGSVTGDRGLDH